MRDPDLIQRAERAAGALERAWDRWRTMHGYGSEPLPPVSSYVGYSMEEPWGQPRVVFGVAADEAEQLAALLDGHDCYGPIHAEVTSRPDWLRAPATDLGSYPRPVDRLSIPPQARPPADDLLGSASEAFGPARQRDGAQGINGNVIEPGLADATVFDEPELPASGAVGDAFVISAAPTEDAPDEVDNRPGRVDRARPGEQATNVVSARTPQELEPLPPMPDPAPTGPMGSASLAPAKTSNKGVKATGGPGYRGPRYQGSPPRYKAGRGPANATPADLADAADTGTTADAPAAAGTVATAGTAATAADFAPTAGTADAAAAVGTGDSSDAAHTGASAGASDAVDAAANPGTVDPVATVGSAAAAATVGTADSSDAADTGATAGASDAIDAAATAGTADPAATAGSAAAAATADAKSGVSRSTPASKPTRANSRQPSKTSRASNASQASKASQPSNVSHAPRAGQASRAGQQPKTARAPRQGQGATATRESEGEPPAE